jgi:hypothetical protein
MKTPVEEFASVLQQLTEKVRELELRRCRPGRARPMVAVRVVSHSSRGDASSSVRRAAGFPRAASGDRPLVADCRRYLAILEWRLFILGLQSRPQICLKENRTPVLRKNSIPLDLSC